MPLSIISILSNKDWCDSSPPHESDKNVLYFGFCRHGPGDRSTYKTQWEFLG